MEVTSMAALDSSQCPVVESVPGKMSGAWVLKGTRMPVSAIFENLEAGANLDDIMEWFDGLDREQVKAVIEFAARSLDIPPCTHPRFRSRCGFFSIRRRPSRFERISKATLY
jgi:uncharacterized protein (DUF433 family)